MTRKQDSHAVDGSHMALPTLPLGWCWTALATISRIAGGITKDKNRKQTASTRKVPYLRVANVQRGFLDLQEVKTILADEAEIKTLRLEKGDVLFTEGGDRDKLGRGWVWNEEIDECIHQNHIFRARPDRELAEPKFVSYHGNFFGQEWFTKTGKQTTNLASINKGVLSRFPIPLAPPNEQRRIVQKIEELFSKLDAGVAALERVKANLKRYRATVLKAAVEGKLTAEWRARHPDTEPASKMLERMLKERRRKWEEGQLAKYAAAGKEPPKAWKEKYKEPEKINSNVRPELPKAWCWTSLRTIAEVVGGITKGQKRHPTVVVRSVPYLRVANVQRGFFDLAEVKYIDATEGEIRELRLIKGDVLFTEGGDRDKLGRGWVWDEQIEESIHQNHIFRARLYSLHVQPKFVSYYGNSVAQRYFVGQGVQTTNLASINLQKLGSLPIPLPPVEEQEQIVAEVERRLSIVDELEAQVGADLKRAGRLRQSILKKAFAGRLVPQDPRDEPAAKLLDRIRANV
jgi:type I restriction enzyme S subunit